MHYLFPNYACPRIGVEYIIIYHYKKLELESPRQLKLVMDRVHCDHKKLPIRQGLKAEVEPFKQCVFPL